MYSKKLIGTIGTSVLASAFLLEKNFNKNKIEDTFTYDECRCIDSFMDLVY